MISREEVSRLGPGRHLLGPSAGVAYFLTGKLGLALAQTHDHVTLVWPPTGIALAALFFTRLRAWPWILAGAFALNATTDLPLPAVALVALGNTAAMAAGAALLRRLDFSPALRRVTDVGLLLAVGALGAVAISATVGSLTLLAAGALDGAPLVSVWWTWWLGDGLGVLFLAPLLFTVGEALSTGSGRRPRSWVTAVSLSSLVVLALLFRAWESTPGAHYLVLFLPVPLVTWVALSSGPRGVSWLVFAFTTLAVSLTVLGQGPFVTPESAMGLLWLQGFTGATALIGFLLAASRAEDQRVKELLREAAAVFDATNDGIALLGCDGRIRGANPALARMLGRDAGELAGRPLDDFRSGGGGAENFDAVQGILLADKRWSGEASLTGEGGAALPVWESLALVRNGGGDTASVIGVYSDIRRIKAHQAALTEQARHDPLTGLLNRSAFEAELERALGSADRHDRRLGLLFVDLDNFKIVNDSLGHHFGDALLQAVADRLAQVVRTEDVVSRLGGDEFTVLLTEVHSEEATVDNAQRILDELTRPIHLLGEQVVVAPSIGVALYPDHAGDAAQLLRAADQAMYSAKATGARAIVSAEAGPSTDPRCELRDAARIQGILDEGRLSVVYQPIVEPRSRAIEGLEALVRQPDPATGELRAAGDLVKRAEHLGLAEKLTAHVLGRVAADVARWEADGIAVGSVAVNVPGRLFLSAAGVASFRSLLRDTGLLATSSKLVLEMTESSLRLLRNSSDLLEPLRADGVRFAIDGFGLERTSLSELRGSSADALKVDRSFVARVPGKAADEAICRCLVSLASSLGMRSIAVGVETGAQRRFLLEAGCDLMQGHHFHEPIPANRVPALFRDREQAWQAGASPGPGAA